jgi:hypothetical protein
MFLASEPNIQRDRTLLLLDGGNTDARDFWNQFLIHKLLRLLRGFYQIHEMPNNRMSLNLMIRDMLKEVYRLSRIRRIDPSVQKIRGNRDIRL